MFSKIAVKAINQNTFTKISTVKCGKLNFEYKYIFNTENTFCYFCYK